jgi:hypothetical protein
MSDIVKGMARVIVESMGDTPENAARDALLFLANNVSDEMVQAAGHFSRANGWTLKAVIAAAIHAAAGSEG